jgi:hypothetical protein
MVEWATEEFFEAASSSSLPDTPEFLFCEAEGIS